jgi:transcriptional regulator with XRE-family HTH domain
MPPNKTVLESNPIRIARLQHGKTLEEFSKLTGVHYQAVYNNENGCYPRILPNLLTYLCEHWEMDRQELEQAYSEFVRGRREAFYSLHNPYSLPLPSGIHPFSAWRQSLGLTVRALSKDLCVSPSQLNRLEKNKTPNLPLEIERALIQVQFPDDLLQELKDRAEEYYFLTN